MCVSECMCVCVYVCVPGTSRLRALRDTVIFSSELRTQSIIPRQPFKGKVTSAVMVRGRFWMLSSEEMVRKQQSNTHRHRYLSDSVS